MELKPCPFCGGDARIEDDLDEGGSCVSCKRCMACSAVHFDRKENLVSDWNRRSPLSQETVEELKWLASDAESLGGGVYRDRLTGASIARLVRRVLDEIEGKQS